MDNYNIVNQENNEKAAVFNEKVISPPTWGGKFEGRYGRLNYINSTLIISGLAFIPLAIFGCILGYTFYMYERYESGFMLAAIVVLCFIVLLLLVLLWFFYMRTVVLRLHDMNLSGFYAIPILTIPLLLAIMQALFTLLGNGGEMLAAIFSGLSSLFSLVVSILLMAIPGTSGENKYGKQSFQGPWTGLIILLAFVVLYILLMIVALFVVTLSASRF